MDEYDTKVSITMIWYSRWVLIPYKPYKSTLILSCDYIYVATLIMKQNIFNVENSQLKATDPANPLKYLVSAYNYVTLSSMVVCEGEAH